MEPLPNGRRVSVHSRTFPIWSKVPLGLIEPLLPTGTVSPEVGPKQLQEPVGFEWLLEIAS